MPFNPEEGLPFGSDQLTLEVGALGLSHLEWSYDLWNPQALLGSDPHDELLLFFLMEPDVFLSHAVGDSYDVALVNNSDRALCITAVGQSTGSIRKLGMNPFGATL